MIVMRIKLVTVISIKVTIAQIVKKSIAQFIVRSDVHNSPLSHPDFFDTATWWWCLLCLVIVFSSYKYAFEITSCHDIQCCIIILVGEQQTTGKQEIRNGKVLNRIEKNATLYNII